MLEVLRQYLFLPLGGAKQHKFYSTDNIRGGIIIIVLFLSARRRRATWTCPRWSSSCRTTWRWWKRSPALWRSTLGPVSASSGWKDDILRHSCRWSTASSQGSTPGKGIFLRHVVNNLAVYWLKILIGEILFWNCSFSTNFFSLI